VVSRLADREHAAATITGIQRDMLGRIARASPAGLRQIRRDRACFRRRPEWRREVSHRAQAARRARGGHRRCPRFRSVDLQRDRADVADVRPNMSGARPYSKACSAVIAT
jgi:hypothetical protein